MFKISKKDIEDTFARSKKLKRVRDKNFRMRTIIVGGSESEVQTVKTKLDTLILARKKESKAKKELRRLGFLA